MCTSSCRKASSIWAAPGQEHRGADRASSRWPVSASRPRPLNGPGRRAFPPLPDRPSIAVLPFNNFGGDPEQEYFADGLVEEIITSLSRVRSFLVIARNSSFTYKGRAVDVRQVARELGVRYVLEGSIRKAGTRLRVVGQLVDASSGHHVWADRFDGDLADISTCRTRSRSRWWVRSSPPSGWPRSGRPAPSRRASITAYDLYLRALPHFYSMTREGFAQVRRLTEEALAVDPQFHLARALGAYIRSISVSQCWHEPDDGGLAVRMAREVYAEARDDPTCLRFAAQALAYTAKDYETALSATERSLQSQPELRAGLYRRRLGQRPCRATPAGDRVLPSCHAPEPARSREGHRPVRHRHELPHARTVRGCPALGGAGS